jgi:hypothetical protein
VKVWSLEVICKTQILLVAFGTGKYFTSDNVFAIAIALKENKITVIPIFYVASIMSNFYDKGKRTT